MRGVDSECVGILIEKMKKGGLVNTNWKEQEDRDGKAREKEAEGEGRGGKIPFV